MTHSTKLLSELALLIAACHDSKATLKDIPLFVDKNRGPDEVCQGRVNPIWPFRGTCSRPMPEEVRPQYETAVTKPLDTVLSPEQTF